MRLDLEECSVLEVFGHTDCSNITRPESTHSSLVGGNQAYIPSFEGASLCVSHFSCLCISVSTKTSRLLTALQDLKLGPFFFYLEEQVMIF